MESSKRPEATLQTRGTDTIEVSYSILTVPKDNPKEVLEKFATSINVQLTFLSGQQFPYVPFNEFYKLKEASKIFLYGPSGCGKSKGIFEIVKSRVAHLNKIYVINPRVTIGESAGRSNLGELLNKVGPEDAIVWDNFPDDMIDRDVNNAIRALQFISSKNLGTLLVALKPRYLEIYGEVPRRIPEFYTHRIEYEREKIKEILDSYGSQITDFSSLYNLFIMNDIERLSKILWTKEPLPLTIIDYYKLLQSKKKDEDQLDQQAAAILAEDLSRRTVYYEDQFGFLSSEETRLDEAEFLYTLRLCYEAALDRKVGAVEKLQNQVFGSIPPREPLKKLSTWVYLSGQFYAMHDVCRDAIKLNDYTRLKITNYLTEHFSEIIKQNDDSALYTLGLFLGRNIQFMNRDAAQPFVPNEIYNFMKGNRYFETGFGRGIAESFFSLESELQKVILKRVEVDLEFARGLGDGLGHNFASLDQRSQQQILKGITSGLPFRAAIRRSGSSLRLPPFRGPPSHLRPHSAR